MVVTDAHAMPPTARKSSPTASTSSIQDCQNNLLAQNPPSTSNKSFQAALCNASNQKLYGNRGASVSRVTSSFPILQQHIGDDDGVEDRFHNWPQANSLVLSSPNDTPHSSSMSLTMVSSWSPLGTTIGEALQVDKIGSSPKAYHAMSSLDANPSFFSLKLSI